MNTKWYILFAFAALCFSCKRELSQFSAKEEKGPVWASNAASSRNPYESQAFEIKKEEGKDSSQTAEGKELKKELFSKEKKELILKSLAEKNILKKEVRKRIREKKQIQKEMNPRLSRALWMTIFGGVATTLGIVFMAYAPTGLFIFVFGFLFLIGLVSLIMYLANPKPKM